MNNTGQELDVLTRLTKLECQNRRLTVGLIAIIIGMAALIGIAGGAQAQTCAYPYCNAPRGYSVPPLPQPAPPAQTYVPDPYYNEAVPPPLRNNGSNNGWVQLPQQQVTPMPQYEQPQPQNEVGPVNPITHGYGPPQPPALPGE